MKRKKYSVGIVFVLVLFLFGFQECVVPGPVGPTPQPGVEKASVNGKYNDLLNVIDVPDDMNKYGEFYELGYKKWTTYRGYRNLEKGYWVYVYPSWYIWKSKSGGGGGNASLDEGRARVNGKYNNLLKVINVPDDRHNYRDLYEGGYRTTTSYKGNYSLPSGYWVYLSPYWYIWESKSGGGGGNASLDEDRARVNGKYNNLLKVINVPRDKYTYRDLYEGGYRTTTSYKGNYSLPSGYWVYLSPYWYIWKNEAYSPDPQPSIDKRGASLNGKYSNLKKTLYIPSDKKKHGGSKDFGNYRNQKTYYDFRNLPSGYWVYYYPYMYIWGEKSGGDNNTDKNKAKVNGKYSGLLKKLYVPNDNRNYGNFNDYGYSDKSNYKRYYNIPSGYWVYVYPNWYIWKNEAGSPYNKPSLDKRSASFNGKYKNLRKALYIPSDKKKHGNSKDFGNYRNQKTYYDFRNLPSGYWVYYYPYMYIWGKKRGDKPNPDWNIWDDRPGWPSTSEPPIDKRGASLNGKYSNLKKTLYIPSDKKKHGDSKDFGNYRNQKTYYDFRNLPSGYWVYYYPYMYIWGKKEGTNKPPIDKEGASFNGKYRNLRKTLYIPSDKKKHGGSKDFGNYRNQKTYYDFRNLPSGYWVYYYPYMYIWGQKR